MSRYHYKTPASKDKVVSLSDNFLVEWHVVMAGRRSFYVRDAKVKCLLVNYSKKGSHSFAFDYRSGTMHKSKVFGYFPSMTVDEAREKAQEIQKRLHRYPAMIYFLQSDDMIKIGKSNNIWDRMRDLVGSQDGVFLLGMREQNNAVTESKLHHVYRALRHPDNEYFKKDHLLLEFIQRWCVARSNDADIKRLLKRHETELYVDK